MWHVTRLAPMRAQFSRPIFLIIHFTPTLTLTRPSPSRYEHAKSVQSASSLLGCNWSRRKTTRLWPCWYVCVCVCVCACACVCVYSFVCIRICVALLVCVCSFICLFVCLFVCIRIFVRCWYVFVCLFVFIITYFCKWKTAHIGTLY